MVAQESIQLYLHFSSNNDTQETSVVHWGHNTNMQAGDMRCSSLPEWNHVGAEAMLMRACCGYPAAALSHGSRVCMDVSTTANLQAELAAFELHVDVGAG